MDMSRFIFKGSPFLPVFNHHQVTDRAIRLIHTGTKHAPAIALATYQLMSPHINLLSLDRDTLSRYRVSPSDLRHLNLGFQFPLQTIMASAACMQYQAEEWPAIFETIVVTTLDFDNLRAQDQILQDLRATINLLKLDPSGALVFQFLKNYPFSSDEYFSNGMEIAAMIFFGVSLEVAEKTGDNHWLNVPIVNPNQT